MNKKWQMTHKLTQKSLKFLLMWSTPQWSPRSHGWTDSVSISTEGAITKLPKNTGQVSVVCSTDTATDRSALRAKKRYGFKQLRMAFCTYWLWCRCGHKPTRSKKPTMIISAYSSTHNECLVRTDGRTDRQKSVLHRLAFASQLAKNTIPSLRRCHLQNRILFCSWKQEYHFWRAAKQNRAYVIPISVCLSVRLSVRLCVRALLLDRSEHL